MAIQIDLTTSQYGTSFSDAYFRIVLVAITRERSSETKFSVMIDVAGYATATPNEDTRDVEFRRYNANMAAVEAMSGAAFMDKCYAWVMAQEDMAGSEAV